MKKKFFFMLMSLFMVTGLYAYDFTATCSSGQTLAYTIVDAGAKTVEVAQPDAMPEGNVNIDATVVNPDDSETYTVIGIGTLRQRHLLISVSMMRINTALITPD